MNRRRAPLHGAPLLGAAVTWIVAILAAIGPASGRVAAYADGAPPGFSGGFGEQACDACHFEAPLNTKPGQLTIAGVPERFVGGESYPITITLSRPGMAMGGFQFAVRMESGGAQAGAVAPGPGEEKRVTVEKGSIQYVNQRLPGTTLASPGIAKWTLVWTAPKTGGSVVFHAAANAADKDEAARGDYVYTAVVQSRPTQAARFEALNIRPAGGVVLTERIRPAARPPASPARHSSGPVSLATP